MRSPPTCLITSVGETPTSLVGALDTVPGPRDINCNQPLECFRVTCTASKVFQFVHGMSRGVPCLYAVPGAATLSPTTTQVRDSSGLPAPMTPSSNLRVPDSCLTGAGSEAAAWSRVRTRGRIPMVGNPPSFCAPLSATRPQTWDWGRKYKRSHRCMAPWPDF